MFSSSTHSQPILVIGGTGMLGRPAVRRLVQDGFSVRIMARHPERARRLLPPPTDIWKGDLADVKTIDRALENCQAVYLSVDSELKNPFKAETDGLKNVISALKNHPKARLIILSAFQSSSAEAKEHSWWRARHKYEAQQIAMASNCPWTILEPTWFMESLPLFVKNNVFSAITCKLEPYWVAGDDMGRVLSTCLSKKMGEEKSIPIQGPEKLSLKEAGKRFARAYNSKIKVRSIPLWMLKMAGFFSGEAKELATLLSLSDEEPSPDTQLWDEYGAPSMTIEGYAGYCRGTGDFPQK